MGKAFSLPPSLITSVVLWIPIPSSCEAAGGEGIGFHNPSFQAATRLLEGEECAGENVPVAVKRHSFLSSFPPRVTLGCLCPPGLPFLCK